MRILQLVPRLPYPLDDGGKIGIAGILEAFSQLGHEVTVGGFDEENRLAEAAAPLHKHAVDLFVEDIPAIRVMRAKALVALGLAPYVREKYHSKTFARKVLALVGSWKPDLLHLDHSHMGSYGALVKQRYPEIKVWLRAHNVEWSIWERRAAATSDPMWAAILRRQAALVRNYENRLFETVDGVAAITLEDSERIRQGTPEANIHLMTAGYDLQTPTVLRPRFDDEPRLCFVGSLDYSANSDGLSWLIKEVWPSIRHAYSRATLTVAGRSSQRLRMLENVPGVSYLGFVPEVRTVTDHADIALVPLRIGGGMRLKILDFLSRGLPIISTRIGAEGIPSSYHGQPTLRVADTATEFLAQLADLGSLARRERQAKAGREMIERDYSWTALVMKYCDAVQQSRPSKAKAEEHT